MINVFSGISLVFYSLLLSCLLLLLLPLLVLPHINIFLQLKKRIKRFRVVKFAAIMFLTWFSKCEVELRSTVVIN